MSPETYLFEATLAAAWPRLAQPLTDATAALARYDEALHRLDGGLADGARARLDLLDAQAALRLEGLHAPLEDIVLHDASMDARPPTPDLRRADAFLAERRALARRRPDAILDPSALRRLLHLPDEPDGPPAAASAAAPAPGWAGLPTVSLDADEPDRAPEDEIDDFPDDLEDDPESDLKAELQRDPVSPEQALARGPQTAARGAPADWRLDPLGDAAATLDRAVAKTRRALDAYNDLTTDAGRRALRLADPEIDPAARLTAWRRTLTATDPLPGVLAAALALDAWFWLEPADVGLGALLAAAVLRQRGAAAHHLPPLALALHRSGLRWRREQPPAQRWSALLAAIGQGGRLADLQRLSSARDVMRQRLRGKRRTSRLSDLIDLFVASPLVTVGLAAERLGVTPQAVDAMLADLGGALPRELTGRRRYRAWGIL